MIIVRVKGGGLGNQMLQYAAGRALALNTGLPLVLDLRHYDSCVNKVELSQVVQIRNVSIGCIQALREQGGIARRLH